MKVSDILSSCPESLRLSLKTGEKGNCRTVQAIDLNRPGLALAGSFEHFRAERIQVFGMGETTYLGTLSPSRRLEILEQILTHRELPCVILTHGNQPMPEMMELCERYEVPLLMSELSTADLTAELKAFLEERMSPTTTVHGVLVEVYGLGVLITGEPGIGKSECSLELLKRGHLLVTDDSVELRHTPGDIIVGGPIGPLGQSHMEVRGLGIIDVTRIFGIGASINRTRIQLVARFEIWDPAKPYDRTGMEKRTAEILGVRIPEILLPVKPGRNMAVLIEVATLNQRLRETGQGAPEAFNDRLIQHMNRQSK